MMYFKKTLLKSILLGSCLYSSHAVGDEVQNYICIEQKVVGWQLKEDDTKNGDAYNIGQFKPSEERFFIKYRPLELKENGEVSKLPSIEEIQKGESRILEYETCDFIFRDFVLGKTLASGDKNYQLESCKNVMKMGEGFGNGEYNFAPHLFEKPKSTTYTKALTSVSRLMAYVSSGSCVLSN